MSIKGISFSREVFGRPVWQILIVGVILLFVLSNGHPLEKIQGSLTGKIALASLVGNAGNINVNGVSCEQPSSSSSGVTTYLTPATASLGCRSSGEFVTDTASLSRTQDNLFNQVWEGKISCLKTTQQCQIYAYIDIDPQLFSGNAYTVNYKVCDTSDCSVSSSPPISRQTFSATRIDTLLATIAQGKTIWIQVDNPKILSGGATSVTAKSKFERWDLVSFNYFDGTGQQKINTGSCSVPMQFNDPAKGVIIDKSLTQDGTPDKLAISNTQSFNYIYAWIPFASIGDGKSPLVAYNGQQSYCLASNIWSINTFNADDGTCYAFPNKNTGTSVQCCPGSETPTQVCGSDFLWKPRQTADVQCVSDATCQPYWTPDYAKDQIFSGKCINNKCEYSYKSVECLPGDGSCGTGYCDLNQFDGTATCKSASDLPSGGGNATTDWFFWIVLVLVVIIILIIAGVWIL